VLRTRVLFYTAVFLYLNQSFSESLTLLQRVETTIAEQNILEDLLPEVLTLKALIYMVIGKFDEALDFINDAVVFLEKDNDSLLIALTKEKFSELCLKQTFPKFTSERTMHLLLLIFDIYFLKNDTKTATYLLSKHSSYWQANPPEDYFVYIFYLHLMKFKIDLKNTSDSEITLIIQTLHQHVKEHPMLYPYFRHEYINLLNSTKSFNELSTYEKDIGLNMPELTEETPEHGYELDMNDWDIQTRFSPHTNPSFVSQLPPNIACHLRIKLSPSMLP
jgi:tetratricopeptide (TPR) repeat protein